MKLKREQPYFSELLREYGALLEGHFLLTSGLHSGQYLEKFRILPYPRGITPICDEFAEFALDNEAHVVAAPAVGGIILACETGRSAGIPFVFTERGDSNVMTLKRTGFREIVEGNNVALLEDVVTTGGSVLECADAVREAGGVISSVSIIVDRSEGKFAQAFAGIPFQALVEMDIPTYSADECPMCKEGIPIVKP